MTIEGIPDGWVALKFDHSAFGDNWIDEMGQIHSHEADLHSKYKRLIIRKIEKPKTYRAFANAAEFEPHRDRWLMHPREPDKRFKPGDYNDQGVWGLDRRHYDYQHLFECGTLFDDGTPFGVEVAS